MEQNQVNSINLILHTLIVVFSIIFYIYKAKFCSKNSIDKIAPMAGLERKTNLESNQDPDHSIIDIETKIDFRPKEEEQ